MVPQCTLVRGYCDFDLELTMVFLLLQAAIRKELNEFKSKEMEVHVESKQFTRLGSPSD